MKISLFLLSYFCLFCSISYGQVTISRQKVAIDKPKSSPISIIDSYSNIHLFFHTKKELVYLRYDKEYNFISENKLAMPPKAYKTLIGYGITEDNQINLYFSNEKNKKFYLLGLQKNKVVARKEIIFKLRKEKLVSIINYNNTFYLLSALKDASKLNLRTFKKDTYHSTLFSFGNTHFYNKDGAPAYLSNIMDTDKVVLIEDNAPNAIENTSKTIKVYPKKDHIYISLDHRNQYSRILDLDLKEGKPKLRDFPIPDSLFSESKSPKSNSFIFKDRVFQFKSSWEQFLLLISDLDSRRVLKQYSFNRQEEIAFKNTAIIQEDSLSSTRTRELEKTKQFLRKVNNAETAGLVAFENKNKLQLTIGGFTKIEYDSEYYTVPGSPSDGFVLNSNVVLNPLAFTYKSYVRTKSVYFKTLLDKNSLEHLKAPIKKNIFDRIRSHSEYQYSVSMETIFKHQNHFIFGYYEKESEYYFLVKFAE